MHLNTIIMLKSVLIYFFLLIFLKVEADKKGSDCIRVKPNCPNNNVTFWLYRRNLNSIKIDLDKLKRNYFLSRKQLVVLIHGYAGDKNSSPNLQLRPVLLSKSDISVLSIDYKPLAVEKCYIYAVDNFLTISKCIAQFLNVIVKKNFIEAKDIHIIGYSLGAHIAAAVGNYFEYGKLKRITGLDPAGPLFWHRNFFKLNDATFIDIIHTDGLFNGILTPLGHADFYPNGGTFQPDKRSCSHSRAPTYFAESILFKDGFWAYPCFGQILSKICEYKNKSNAVLMGYNANISARGVYYLRTNSRAPFGLGRVN